MKKKGKGWRSIFRPLSAFTLAELIVVITVLAILSAIGFIALSWYAKDAADARSKTNVRSVYTAIGAESAVTGNSPRFYVIHESGAALSWGFVTFDASSPPTALTGGSWNQSGTNYSAGKPDYVKLKLNPEKFKTSLFRALEKTAAASAFDLSEPTVWAADVTSVENWWSPKRTVSYYQAVTIQPSWTAFVVGNYPTDSSWSVSWLVKDPSIPSSSWALVEWAKPEWSVACAPSVVSWYSVPGLQDWTTENVSKTIANGSVSATAKCVAWTVSLESETPTCSIGYGWWGTACLPSVTGSCWTASKTYAFVAASYGSDAYCASGNPNSSPAFPAAGASVSWTCLGSYGWADSGNCTATHSAASNCPASPQTVNGHSYSVASVAHGNSVVSTSSVAVSNGTRTFQQTFSCWNGTVATSWSESNTANACNTGYSWNGSSCVANAWSTSAWWACSWETWTWGYSAWWACSVACGGWTQSRTATCTRNGNGTQTRTVQCLRYDGSALSDSNCLAAKPGTSQSCTQGTDSVCWSVAATSQSCNTQWCPQNGACSWTPGACSVWSPYSDNWQTACSTTRTWSCSWVNWGAAVGCSSANPACSTSVTLTASVCDPYYGCYGTYSCPVTFTKVWSVQCVWCAYHWWNNVHVLAKIQWWAWNSFSYLRWPEVVNGWGFAWDGQWWTNCTSEFHSYTPHY